MILKKLLVLTSTIFLVSTAHAAKKGTETGGGGDASEERVNEIRKDILSWLDTDGPKNLLLPYDLTFSSYISKMKDILEPKKVIIGFIEKDDELNDELKVSVDGVPKTCRGFISEATSEPHIICNIARFKMNSESEQYKLIHHEYAGLAGVEKNSGAASDYRISSQLTDFLAKQTILKLAVKKPGPTNCKLLVAFQKSPVKVIEFGNPTTNLLTGAQERTAQYKSLSATIIEGGGTMGINITDYAKKSFYASEFKNSAIHATSDYTAQINCN